MAVFVVVLLFTRGNSTPNVVFLDPDTAQAEMKQPVWRVGVERVLRLVPPLWRIINRKLDIQTALYEVRRSNDELIALLPTNVVATRTNSLRAWALDPVQFAAFKTQVKTSGCLRDISGPRVSTAEGVISKCSTGKSVPFNGGQRFTGIEVALFPHVNSGEVRLLSHILFTDSRMNRAVIPNQVTIITNFNIGVRTSFRDRGGVFVLDAKNSTAVLISAELQKAK
jgi:hypothetical protein